MTNRVVLTGIGVISPIGNGREAFWQALVDGKNGIERITRFDASECASQIAGEVKDFKPEDYIDKKEVKRMDRYTQFAVAASKMAVEDAGLDMEKEDRDRIGTYIGSGVGGIDTLHAQYKKLFDKGPHFVSPFFIPGFSSMKALCTDHNDDPAHASRPFDKNRSGFVMGEGAGIVILETLEHAKKRGAHIYAEVAGYGRNSDAYHVTSPAPHGVYQAKCMSLAIADAGLSPDDIDYVNAHGTSTHMNDLGETEACKTVFGARAKDVPISSVKSMTGHMLGAAGGVECIATALTVENDMLPPTINYETVDVEEGLDLDYVPNVSRKHTVRAAISNNFGFGGHNACVVLKKFAE